MADAVVGLELAIFLLVVKQKGKCNQHEAMVGLFMVYQRVL